MLCATCGARRGCACEAGVVPGDPDSMTGSGSGSAPYVFTVTDDMLALCLEPYMNNLGFDLDTIGGNPRFVVPVAIPAGYILIADGVGGASWQAP